MRIYCSLVLSLWILIRPRSWNSNQAFCRSQTFPSLPQFTRKKRKEGGKEGPGRQQLNSCVLTMVTFDKFLFFSFPGIICSPQA